MKANWLYKATAESEKPIIIHQGGTSSGKTYAILQYLITVAASKPDKVITVVGQDIPNLKVGAYRDAQNIVESEDFFRQQLDSHNRSNRVFEFVTGSIIEFNSYSDEQDAKSGKRTHSFFNEANGIGFGIFEQINMRTSEQTIIDFNPSARFWAHDKLYGLDEVDWYVSTFADNDFIEPEVKKKILSYKPTPENIERGTANEYRWNVYGLGRVGRLEGLVFPDFELTSDWPDEYKWVVYGLDFGFTNDPTALVEIRYSHGNLYWKEHIYETGMTNPEIADELKRLEFDRSTKIVADSAEPKSIEEISRKGLHIIGAEKGRDSINQGIDAIKRYPIYVDGGSKNLIEEFSSYTWKEDKDGKSTNKPIDDFNHGIDAGRYALQHKLIGKTKKAGALF